MKFIIDMPKGWSMADPCKDCPFECDSCTFPALNCPLGHAKEAVEIKLTGGDWVYKDSKRIGAMPKAKLWATEGK